jgi:hypothetical protein
MLVHQPQIIRRRALMRKIVLSLAGAAAALAVATPAAAQYYPGPQQPGPGYGQGYGNRHGNWQQVRDLRVRLDQVRRQIDRLDRRDAISGRATDRLIDDANRINRRLNERARGGLDPREAGDIQFRIQRLEQQVQWARERRWDRFRDDRARDRH